MESHDRLKSPLYDRTMFERLVMRRVISEHMCRRRERICAGGEPKAEESDE